METGLLKILFFSFLAFGLYLGIICLPGVKRWLATWDNPWPVSLARLLGSVCFICLPLLYLKLNPMAKDFFIDATRHDGGGWAWLLLAIGLLLPLNLKVANNPVNLAMYPQMRFSGWNVPHVLLSTITWGFYLLGYEFLFRGFLLFGSLIYLGLWPAIILNASLYTLAHLHKNARETLASFPFGIFVAWLAIRYGSFWLPFFIHFIMAISNEWSSIYHHPEMNMYINRKKHG